MKMFLFLALVLSTDVMAAPQIVLKNAHIKEMPPGMTTTAAFVHITNNSDKDVELLGVEGNFAKSYELHEMDMSGGKMTMRRVPSILIKKHGTTELTSGGLHIMVFGLKKPIVKKEKYSMKLNFSNKESIQVEASAI